MVLLLNTDAFVLEAATSSSFAVCASFQFFFFFFVGQVSGFKENKIVANCMF